MSAFALLEYYVVVFFRELLTECLDVKINVDTSGHFTFQVSGHDRNQVRKGLLYWFHGRRPRQDEQRFLSRTSTKQRAISGHIAERRIETSSTNRFTYYITLAASITVSVMRQSGVRLSVRLSIRPSVYLTICLSGLSVCPVFLSRYLQLDK